MQALKTTLQNNKTESSSDFNRHRNSDTIFQNCIIKSEISSYNLDDLVQKQMNQIFKCSNANEQIVQKFIQMNYMLKSHKCIQKMQF